MAALAGVMAYHGHPCIGYRDDIGGELYVKRINDEVS